jgi:hypothetical protein
VFSFSTFSYAPVGTSTPTGTVSDPQQGFAGGQGYASSFAGGGGGGAGGPGQNASSAFGGAGGPGVQYDITGVMIYYGVGGGGAAGGYTGSAGAAGLGGGGAGGFVNFTLMKEVLAKPGRPNSGDGGGGNYQNVPAPGGSGIVIIRY